MSAKPNITSPKDGKRKQVDFRIRVQGETHLCELKALCISRAAGTPRNLQFYFRDDDLGLVKDFRKLDELPGGNKWMLAFVYPAPNSTDWDRTISSLPNPAETLAACDQTAGFPRICFHFSMEGMTLLKGWAP